MVSPATARLVVGVTGNITSLFLYLSPVPTFISICKNKSVQQHPAATYLVALLNCMILTLSGMPFIQPNNILVSTISGIGFIIEIVYLLLFFIYSDTKTKRIIVIVALSEMVAVGIALALVLRFVKTTKQRALIIGLLGNASDVVMYAAPLFVMKQVITTKSVEFMSLAISVTSFANAIVWTLYSLYPPLELYDVIPNGIECILGLAQLILYATYYKSTKQQMEDRKAAPDIEMGL